MAVGELTDDEFDALLHSLEKADPGDGLHVEKLVRRAADSVPRLSRKEARGLVRALLSFHSARVVHNHSIAELAEGIAISETLGLTPEASGSLGTRLAALAQIRTVALTAKAIDIAREQDRNFHSARILSDLRPVFGDDPNEPPIGVVVSHVLRIDAVRNGQLEDYFVTLDNSDLLAIRDVVARALSKNQSLDNVLGNIGFARIEPTEEGQVPHA